MNSVSPSASAEKLRRLSLAISRIFPAGCPYFIIFFAVLNVCWLTLPLCYLASNSLVVRGFPGFAELAIIFMVIGVTCFSFQQFDPTKERGSGGTFWFLGIIGATGVYGYAWTLNVLLLVLQRSYFGIPG